MENLQPHEQALSNALHRLSAATEVPALEAVKARALFTTQAPAQERQDIVSFIASFLNLKVKLYHVVIVFVCIWLCYVYFDQKPETIKHEATRSAQSSPLASTNNSTVLPCIQTYCLKK